MSGRDHFETWLVRPVVQLGTLVALTEEGTPLVLDASSPDSPVRSARSTVDLSAAHIGGQVVLAFDGGDPLRPIILGVLMQPTGQQRGQFSVEGDDQRVIVSAAEQLVLRCGKASITLTRAGKVLVEGTYVLTRSSGVNRIKGGSVQLN